MQRSPTFRSSSSSGKGRVQPRQFQSPAHRWRTIAFEITLSAAVMLLYFWIRGSRPDDVDAAVGRSLEVVRFEQRIGLFQEAKWQSAFLPHQMLMTVANIVYAWGHYPVLLAIALWLVVKDPVRFRFIRNVLIVSAVIGIATYWLLPAAPPRLMGFHGYDFGFVDTVHGATSGVSYFQPTPFVNDYAALPSFHFGWIALASAAIWVNTASRLIRIGAVSMSVVMWWAVTVTGNHYFLDMIAGGFVVAFSWAFVAFLSSELVRTRLMLLLPGAIRKRIRPTSPFDEPETNEDADWASTGIAD